MCTVSWKCLTTWTAEGMRGFSRAILSKGFEFRIRYPSFNDTSTIRYPAVSLTVTERTNCRLRANNRTNSTALDGIERLRIPNVLGGWIHTTHDTHEGFAYFTLCVSASGRSYWRWSCNRNGCLMQLMIMIHNKLSTRQAEAIHVSLRPCNMVHRQYGHSYRRECAPTHFISGPESGIMVAEVFEECLTVRGMRNRRVLFENVRSELLKDSAPHAD